MVPPLARARHRSVTQLQYRPVPPYSAPIYAAWTVLRGGPFRLSWANSWVNRARAERTEVISILLRGALKPPPLFPPSPRKTRQHRSQGEIGGISLPRTPSRTRINEHPDAPSLAHAAPRNGVNASVRPGAARRANNKSPGQAQAHRMEHNRHTPYRGLCLLCFEHMRHKEHMCWLCLCLELCFYPLGTHT